MISKKVYAPIVRRRSSIFPFRMRCYFDCSEWGAGLVRLGGTGSIRLDLLGTMLNLATGEVYRDERFTGQMQT